MPRAKTDFTAVYPTESVTISFDFTDGLNVAPTTNETLSTIVDVSASVVSGIDTTSSTRLLGSPAISGNFVIQQVGTLQAGVIYNFIASVETSAGQILTTNAHQRCVGIR